MLQSYKAIVNKDTGEIIHAKFNDFNPFDDKKGYLFRTKNFSTKQYQDIKLSEVIKDKQDFMRMHLLAENIFKDTNTIMVRESKRKVRYAAIKDISEMIDLCERNTIQFLNRMVKLEILAEDITLVGETSVTKYVVNPLFFNSSKYISAELYFKFQVSLDYYLPDWVVRTYHEIGNIKYEK